MQNESFGAAWHALRFLRLPQGSVEPQLEPLRMLRLPANSRVV